MKREAKSMKKEAKSMEEFKSLAKKLEESGEKGRITYLSNGVEHRAMVREIKGVLYFAQGSFIIPKSIDHAISLYGKEKTLAYVRQSASTAYDDSLFRPESEKSKLEKRLSIARRAINKLGREDAKRMLGISDTELDLILNQ